MRQKTGNQFSFFIRVVCPNGQRFSFLNRIDHFCTFFAPPGAKNRAIRSNLLAAPKGFPLLSLVPHGLFALRA
ncbi:MAG: hypothetical protein LBT33_01435, partial [Spirochaetia bacterium]|nr:hypothetical protein [Spirochaetia bacterium]